MRTDDYGIFKAVDGNRKLVGPHVLRLANAMRRKNLLPWYPVLVNEGMEVIDGQHRLAAAESLGIPVHYDQIPGLRIEDVMEINTNSRGWTLSDFVDSYVTLGKQDYKVLRDFSVKHGITLSLAALMLMGRSNMEGGGSVAASVRGGDFKVRAAERAEKVATLATGLRGFADFNPLRDRVLLSALARLSDVPGFDFGQLTAKMRLHGLKLEKRPSEKYYILHIEDLYNFHNSLRTDLYQRSYAGAPDRKGRK